MILRGFLVAAGLSVLSACATVAPETGPTRASIPTGNINSVSFPRDIRPRGVPRSNIALAQDFLDLTFALERGETLTGLLRHEAPVRVFVHPGGLQAYRQDIENLLARMRAEAGLDIALTDDQSQARIHIDGVTLRELQRVDPGAACFIVPGETSWRGFRSKSSNQRLRWSAQSTLGNTGIFIPTDTFPQDVRDCIHEEMAQALGPANDLYRLSDSVFNDDNFHSIVTPFDMLMLRALYDRELSSGMPRQVVAGRIVGILDRINPGGSGRGSLPRAPSSSQWKAAIETALTRRNSESRRTAAANRAVAVAQGMSPQDHRLSVALITRGRVNRSRALARAATDFIAAYEHSKKTLGVNDIRTAQAALHVAIVALENRDFLAAMELAELHIEAARRGQNAVLLSSLLAVQSAGLAATGQSAQARAAQLDHLKWARYAYGDSNGARRRAQLEIERILAALEE